MSISVTQLVAHLTLSIWICCKGFYGWMEVLFRNVLFQSTEEKFCTFVLNFSLCFPVQNWQISKNVSNSANFKHFKGWFYENIIKLCFFYIKWTLFDFSQITFFDTHVIRVILPKLYNSGKMCKLASYSKHYFNSNCY